ncbi:hypothetical protein J9R26_004059 [Salmonella enterica]|uniref:Uncharacterized protein n=2 Tax=Salmonella enterica TaxID=28901 RepID=A0A734CHI8_SALET|nr:hypothetical protein [Salmonella enterica]EAA4513088.1 hypothetical protein [Salmonella enterica subsp. enterica serovar Vitkin]EAA6778401.1 hypothetical protein [Salmonella enterica subsp. enterica serovar Braenderup]EAC0002970.1 hypothetical protein [Salmonella enterica subsp. enterica serovar Montevideo]EBG3523511.1 hypothetical protein [Salmonella enterica subsp. enterica]EBY4089170.1 hypothetical protein [Salmonella enterica subsp. enterica serovar Cotham]EBZ4353934.1 hypothetical pro
MITVTISETNGRRKWSHSARTKDALTAIIRTMRKHFPQSHNFIPDDVDNAPVLFAAVASTPGVEVTGHIWKPMWHRGVRWNVKGIPVTVTLHNNALGMLHQDGTNLV